MYAAIDLRSWFDMDKINQIKKKHHYVWSYYLKNWTVDNNIFYITKKGNIARDSVKGLSREDSFYKINALAKEDIAYIKRWSSFSPDHLRDIHESHISDFYRASMFIRYSESQPKNHDLQRAGLALQHNILENYHSGIEKSVLEVVDLLKSGNISVFSDKKKMVSLCSFLGHQLTRTKGFKEKSTHAITFKLSKTEAGAKCAALTERNWWFLSFMFGINIGSSLYLNKENCNFILLENNTDITFITSDRPVINIHPTIETLGKYDSPEEMDLYFPVSPKYALIISESSAYNDMNENLNESDVHLLNLRVVNSADSTIYTNSETTITKYRSAFIARENT